MVKDIRAFHKNLHCWYAENGRDHLPWRNTDDPYAIWLSEIMLQQTQVSTVLERFYQPFLTELPTIFHLATASQSQVMKCWEGLGYYTRARNLHAAAKQLVAEHSDGKMMRWPTDPAAWEILPGVGKNTANAVCSFAFHEPHPVMEANVKRVIARIYKQQDAHSGKGVKQLWTRAEALLDESNPFDYNQAMMDVGSLICTPKAPKCDVCPAAMICEGKATPENYPKKPKSKQIPVRNKQIIVFTNKNHYLVERRGGRFLAGLYGFVELDEGEAVEWQGARVKPTLIGAVSQTYSHFKLEADVYLYEVKNRDERFLPLEEVQKLALSKADHKVLTLLA